MTSEASLEHEYVGALCDAIAAYTRDLAAGTPNAFLYRGADLRFAVERALYFMFVNDEDLFSLFARARRGELRGSVSGGVEPRAGIARQLVNAHTTEVLADASDTPSLPRRLYHHFRALESEWRSRRVATPSPRPEILICIHQPKFVAFLQPLTSRLSVSHAYIGFSGSSRILDFLQRQELPQVASRSSSRFQWRLPEGLAAVPWVASRFDEADAFLRRLQPRCVMLVEGNAPTDEITNRAAARLDIPTVCVQQGWSPIIHNGFRNMSYSRMLAWGDGFVDLLQPLNPLQQFVSTGNFTAPTARPDDRRRKAVAFFLQGPTRILSAEGHSETIRLALRTARDLPDVPIIVRDHPEYPLSADVRALCDALPNVQCLSPDRASVGEILAQSRLAVSVYSSAILDSLAAGVVPVVVNLTSMPRYFPDVAAERCGIEVSNAEAASSVIRRLIDDEAFADSFGPHIERFRRRFFAATGSAAAESAVSVIETIAAA